MDATTPFIRSTEDGDASLEATIADLLADITRRAGEIPHLEALLLGGSLGRGEGSVSHELGGDRLASDVEIYLVGRPASLRDAASRLQAELASAGDADVSVAWLHPTALSAGRAKNLSWKPSRTIRLYELAAGSRVLRGEAPDIRPVDPATLPVDEGVRLVLNRLAEAAPEVARQSDEAARWTDKILIACGDTLLLAGGAYTVRYRDRLTRLRTLSPAWPMPDGWREAVAGAYDRKLTGSRSAPPRAAELDRLVIALLTGAVDRVASIPLEPLATFPQRWVPVAARRPEPLRYLPPIGPRATYEGLVLLVRSARAGHRPTARGLVQALLGRPRSLALQAAALPLWLGIVRGDRSLVAASSRSLRWAGLPPGGIPADDSARLADHLRRHWLVAA